MKTLKIDLDKLAAQYGIDLLVDYRIFTNLITGVPYLEIKGDTKRADG